MPTKRKSTGSRALGAELRRRRGTRTLQQVCALTRSAPFAGRVEPLGVSTLYMIEEGQTMPTLRSLHALATVYRVPVQHLINLVTIEKYRDPLPEASDEAELRRATLQALSECRYEDAHACAQRWQEVAASEDGRIAAANNKASALWKLGYLDEAAMLLLELLGEDELSPPHAVVAYTNLAEVFRSKGSYRLALVQADAGLALADDSMPRAQAYLLRTRANVRSDAWMQRRTGRSDGNGNGAARRPPSPEPLHDALGDYERSSRLFRQVGQDVDVLFNDVSVGQVECLLGRFAAGRRTLERAEREFAQRGHGYGRAGALLELGRAHHDRGQDAAARHALWEAERLAAAGGHSDLSFTIYYYLMRLEERGAGNPAFFFRKCQRLHPLLEARTPEVMAFEGLLVAAGSAS
jgi:tetratricopeptide (TPR) repeat protein